MFIVQNGQGENMLTTDNLFEAIALEVEENRAQIGAGLYPSFRILAFDPATNSTVRVIIEFNI